MDEVFDRDFTFDAASSPDEHLEERFYDNGVVSWVTIKLSLK